jgi:Putative inner membrane protein (DUF1819)
MSDTSRYSFAFTTSSLRLRELVTVAEAMGENREMDYISELGNGKVTTGQKMFSELKKRLAKLTDGEVALLIHGDLNTQKQIAFLAVCKTYAFIREFAVEVLREKVLLFDFKITDGDYLSFYRRKASLHPELEERTTVTQQKIQQVTFKVLEQAGIIDGIKTKVIQPQILNRQLIETIAADDKNWLSVFFRSDIDIEQLR